MSDDNKEGAGVPALPSHQEMADRMANARRGSMCPLCGWDTPHQHSPEEIIIYRNGVKWGRNNGKEQWTGEVCPSATQNEPSDAIRVGRPMRAPTNQHHEYRAGKSNPDRADADGNCGGDGVHGDGGVQEEATPPAVMPAAPSDAVLFALWTECNTPCEANDHTTGPLPFARAVLALSQTMMGPSGAVTDEQIERIATIAHAENRLPWVGFKADADGRYTIPVLSQADIALVRAVLAARLNQAEPAAGEQAGAVAQFCCPHSGHVTVTRTDGSRKCMDCEWQQEKAAPGAASAAREQGGEVGRLRLALTAAGHSLRAIAENRPEDEWRVGTLDAVRSYAKDRARYALDASREEAPATPQAEAPAWPKKATPEMVAAFKLHFKEGSMWTDRLTRAIEAMLEAAPPAAIPFVERKTENVSDNESCGASVSDKQVAAIPAAPSEGARAALEWYRDEAEAIARHLAASNTVAVTASMQVLALDAGRRASEVLTQPTTVQQAEKGGA